MIVSESIQKSNKSARSAGAVGKNAVVPRAVSLWLNDLENRAPLFMRILDFGCGPDMIHVNDLRKEDWAWYVEGTDFGKNFDASKMVHVEEVENQIDIVYASNVFNTHSSYMMSMSAIQDILIALKPNGHLFYNLPPSPNYYWKDNGGVKEFNKMVKGAFGTEPIKFRHALFNSSTTVWTVQKHPELDFSK
jgi:SAM-dependent methyltransferase